MRCPAAFTTATRPVEQVLSNGHGGNGVGNGTKQVLKRPKPRMKNGRNQAAWRAYGAALLHTRVGLTIEQAIACTGSHTDYVDAIEWIMASGDQDLLDCVLYGRVGIFDAAEQVRPLVELRTAYKKLTPDQRVAWAVEENPDRLFEQVVVPASARQRAAAELIPIID